MQCGAGCVTNASCGRLAAHPVRLLRRGTPNDSGGGSGAFFLLLDEPEVHGLPPDPIVPAHDMPAMWKSAIAGAAMIVGVALSTVLGSRKQ